MTRTVRTWRSGSFYAREVVVDSPDGRRTLTEFFSSPWAAQDFEGSASLLDAPEVEVERRRDPSADTVGAPDVRAVLRLAPPPTAPRWLPGVTAEDIAQERAALVEIREDGSWTAPTALDAANSLRRVVRRAPKAGPLPDNLAAPAGSVRELARELSDAVLTLVAAWTPGTKAEAVVQKHFEALTAGRHRGGLSCVTLAAQEGLSAKSVQRAFKLAFLRVVAEVASEPILREKVESYVAEAASR